MVVVNAKTGVLDAEFDPTALVTVALFSAEVDTPPVRGCKKKDYKCIVIIIDQYTPSYPGYSALLMVTH